MTDLFHPQKNFKREKVEGRKVSWAFLNYKQAENQILLGQVEEHIRNLPPEKASPYARYLIQHCDYPLHFFNNCPNVVVRNNDSERI